MTAYADLNLNYAESGGNANRQFFAQAGNADVLDWAARTRSRYHSLQMAVNRPFKDGLLLKGAYTFSKALNETDDDGWVGLTWNQPSQIHRNYARAGYDRPHMLQMGFVYELPFARNSSNPVAYVVKNWQVSGIASWMSGRPFQIGGDNGLLQQVGGQQTINVTGDAKPGFGAAGPNEPWYDPSIFSQPGNAWGNTGRNAFRAPSNYNLDASLFRTIPIGTYPGRDPGGVAERAQSPAVGHPRHRVHGSELHADPCVRQQPGPANGTARGAVRLLASVDVDRNSPGAAFRCPGLFSGGMARVSLVDALSLRPFQPLELAGISSNR